MFINGWGTVACARTSAFAKSKFYSLIILFLTLLCSVNVMAEVRVDANSESCPTGFSIDLTSNLVTDGTFSTLHGGSAEIGDVIAGAFTSSIPYQGDDQYAPDTTSSIQQGPANYLGLIDQGIFPGDPEFEMPELETYLYVNGNDTGSSYRPWIQSIEVEAATNYVFVAYFSNMALLSQDFPILPTVSLEVSQVALGSSIDVVDETEETGDFWIRASRVFTTSEEQLILEVSIVDDAESTFGDDYAITALGVFKCLQDEVAGGAPVAPVDTGCNNCDLISGLDGHAGGSFGMFMFVFLAMAFATRASAYRSSHYWPISSLIGAGALLTAGGVLAENSPAQRNFDNRFYIGVSAGLSKVKPRSRSGSFFVSDDDDSAVGVHVGYDFSPMISVEGHFADLGNAEISRVSDGVFIGDYGYQHFGVSALGYFFNSRRASHYQNGFDDDGLYRREGLSVFGRIGASKLENDFEFQFTQDNGAQLHLGAGLEYGWQNGLAVRAEYISFDRDSETFTLGLSKRFGRANAYERPVVEDFSAMEEAPIDEVSQAVILRNLPTILFDFDSAAINAGAEAQLRTFIDDFSKNPDEFSVVGHTDSKGSQQYNQSLSVQRARAVADYLRSNGLGEIDIRVSGQGEGQPRADNATQAGRALNRRVDFEEK